MRQNVGMPADNLPFNFLKYVVVITSDVALFTAVDITEEVLNAAK